MQFDVAVAGGGPAGVAAALGASFCGCHTLLIERSGFLGGECAGSNVPAYCGFFDRCAEPHIVVGGVGARVLRELTSMGVYHGPCRTPGKNWCVPVMPEAVKLCMDRLTADGPEVLLHLTLVDADREGDRIRSLLCADDEGLIEITAKAFVDATGDAGLACFAGAGIRFGSEGHSQPAGRVMLLTGIAPGADIGPTACAEAVRRAEEDGLGPFARRTGSILNWLQPQSGFAAFGSAALSAVDARALTAAERETRAQCAACAEAFRRYLPGCENITYAWGGSTLGLRETRHIIAEETLRGEDVYAGRKRNDGIGRGVWPMERHTDPSKPAVFRYLQAEDTCYDIPLGILHSADTRNLWAAGRCVDADADAFASVRVAGTSFATGQAAGTAAALFALGKEPSSENVRQSLTAQGALL